MALLLAHNYKPEVFNKVPLFHSAVESLETIELKSILKKISDVFVKHGVHEKYSLYLIHRHFDLNPNEIVVESDGDKSIAFPWVLKGNQVDKAVNPEYQKLVNVDSPVGKIVTPQTWAFSSNGELHPIEFEFKTNADDQQSLDSKFVTELFGILEALGLVNVFGIGIRSPRVGWEYTDTINRANIVQYEHFPEGTDVKLINVQWAFDNCGSIIENGVCYYVYMNGHWYHENML